jgi:hypothetical protein
VIRRRKHAVTQLGERRDADGHLVGMITERPLLLARDEDRGVEDDAQAIQRSSVVSGNASSSSRVSAASAW